MATISIPDPLGVMSGCAFGLQQSSVYGMLAVDGPIDPAAIDRLDHALTGLMKDPVPPRGAPSDDDPAGAYVDRLLQWALILQREHRIPVSMRHVRSVLPNRQQAEAHGGAQASPARHFFALPCVDPQATIASLRAVVAIGNAPWENASNQLEQLAGTLKRFSAPGVNNFSILTAAHDLELPVWEYMPGVWGVGTGARARLFSSTITDRTPAIGVKFARDKRGAAALLKRAGLPATDHLQATSLQMALEHAERLGYPVVIKPADLDQGKGITADIRDPDELRHAWQQASGVSKRILVERHVDGFTHRLTVMQGEVIKVVKRVAGGIIGNGIDDIRTLVAQARTDPLRSRIAARTGRFPLELDDEARKLLARAGLSDTDVPAAGAYIRLRSRDNVNAGGTNELIALDEVHPDNLSAAIGAARSLRLDFAGVDLIIPDIRTSWRDNGGAICEVNGQPQMGTRDTPDIYRTVLAALRPAPGRVPVHLALLSAGTSPGLAAVEPVARATNADTIACTEGIFRAGRRIAGPFADGLLAARAALADPQTRTLAFAMDAQALAKLGLPSARIDSVRLVGALADEAERAVLRKALHQIRDNVNRTTYDKERPQ